MRSIIRKTRSFSLDSDIVAEVERSKGNGSASERVNTLLKTALEIERRNTLCEEAAEFFGTAHDDRQERRAFQNAGIKTWRRS